VSGILSQVRVLPILIRLEIANGGRIIIEVDDKVAKIKNLKVDSRPDGPGGSREKVVAFGFDYCYWSVNPEDPQYASQDVVFQDLGTEVLSGAAKGYNICLFAYGQTGSGKTYTMIGTPASLGLTPRICEGLFSKEDDSSNQPSSCRIRVSFLEIYNERVRDLLKQSDQKKPYTLRVREHPETGPYVQGLSQHVVTNYKQIMSLLEEGVANRITAATHVHKASSRSHAIFTIYYTQVILENNLSSEIASKINLVDLAGSERADPSYCKDRITEGASINKSLVTLGIVISTLAQNSQIFIGYQSPNSTSSEGSSGGLSCSSVAGSIGGAPRKQLYIPYRDSVLTWLLKDSLGGNSKTIMVATVSPANSSYSETMSTLRYASNAKNIINKPRVNEDANVRLIRELREEIQRLKGMLLSFELGNLSPFTNEKKGNLRELVLHDEFKRDQLSKDRTQKWDTWKALLEQYSVDINKEKAGVIIESSLPHLIALDDDVLSTGVVLYHLREGTTKIGRIDSDQEQDIVLQGQWIERDHCTITSVCGVVTLQPALGARCTVNGQEVTASCRLTQGAIIILGETRKFRFIHPAEAAALRQRRLLGEVSAGSSNCSLKWLNLDGAAPAPHLGIEEDRTVCGAITEAYHQKRLDLAVSHRTQIRHQKRLVKDLKQDILVGRIRAEQELEFDQALIKQEIKAKQQWFLKEENWLAGLQRQEDESVLTETDSKIPHVTKSRIKLESEASSSSLDGGRKRLVQLQILWKNALWAAERKVRRKKVKFQLEGIIKKQKLLEAQKKLEQLETLCWDDNSSQPMESEPSLDTGFLTHKKKSKFSSSYSSLDNQRLCGLPLSPSQSTLKCEITAKLSAEAAHRTPEIPPLEEYLLQASVPRGNTSSLNNSCSLNRWEFCERKRASFGEDSLAQRARSTTSLKIAPAMNRKCQEIDRKKELAQLHRNLVSVSRSAEQLQSREKPDTFIARPQIVRAKPLGSYGQLPRRWRKEGQLLSSRAFRGNSPQGARARSLLRGRFQASRLRQAAWTFQHWEPSMALSPRASARLRGHLLSRRDSRNKRFLQVPQSPENSEGEKRTRSTKGLLVSPGSLSAQPQEKGNDFSDSDSMYSMDSLSYACSRSLLKLQEQEAPEPKPLCSEPENTESDDSQMSQDSLMEKRSRTQRWLLPPPLPPQDSERSEAESVTSPEGPHLLLGGALSWENVRAISLDSLDNEEEEEEVEASGGESKKALSPDEMPAEAFWQMKSSQSPTRCPEKVLEFQASEQGPGVAEPDVTLKPCDSFYLASQPQPQPQPQLQPQGEDCKPLQETPNLRNNSLASLESWFSCESGSHHNSSQEVPRYSQINLAVPELKVQEMEKLKAPVEGGELQKPVPKTASTRHSFSRFKGRASVSSTTSEGNSESTSEADTTWASSNLRSDSSVSQESFHMEGIGLPKLAGYCSSALSSSTLSSSRSAAPASLLSHKGSSTLRKGWPIVEYLCEFSHSSLGATVKSTQVSSCPQKDTSCRTFTSGKRWDSFFPLCSEIPGDFDFNNLSFPSSSTRHLRMEQEQDDVSFELDDLSSFFRMIEKDAHHGSSPTDLDQGDLSFENAWVFATETKVPTSMPEMPQICQGSSEQPQPLRKAGSTVSFDESFFLRDISNNSSPMTVKEDRHPPAWTQQEKIPPSKQAPLRVDGPLPQPVLKAEFFQASNEEINTESFSLAFPTDSELFPPWDPFPSPEQLSPLETVYVLESRDAVTETALEIPACRDWGDDTLPTGRVEGLSNTFQFFRNLDSDLLLLLHTPNHKKPSFQRIGTENSFGPGTWEDPDGTGVPQSMEIYNNPVSFSSAQNRLLLESISMATCQVGKSAGTLKNNHSKSPLTKESASAQPLWGVPFNESGATKHLPVMSSIEVDHEHSQSEDDIQGKRAVYLLGIDSADFDEQISSGSNSNFVYNTEGSSQPQPRANMQEKVLGPLQCSSSSHSESTSPVMMGKDETLSHPKEETESVYPGMFLHSKDSSEELMLSGGDQDHSYTKDSTLNLLPAMSTNAEGPIVSEEPESLMVIPSSQGRKSRRRASQGKIVGHSDEMARLISSVSQLESSIMEIESRQKYHPRALYMAEAYKRAMFRERKDQERAHLPRRPKDFRNSLYYKDQPRSSKRIQEKEVVPYSTEARESKELVDTCVQVSHQTEKIPPNLTMPAEFTEEDKTEREPTLLRVPEPSARDPSDYLLIRVSQRPTAQKDPTNVPESPEIVEPLARIESSRLKEERFEGTCREEPVVELNPQSYASIGTGSGPDLEPQVSFQESQTAENLTSTMITAKYKEPRVCDRETSPLEEKSLPTETQPDPLAQELPSLSQIMHMGRFHTQEMAHPLTSQESYPVTSTQEEPSNVFLSDPPKLSEGYFRAPTKTMSFSPTNYERELQFLKMQGTPCLEGKVEQQKTNGEVRNHSSLRSISCKDSSVEESVWQRSHCQLNGSGNGSGRPSRNNYSLEEMEASAPAMLMEWQERDSQVTSKDSNLGNLSLTEAEVTLLRNIKKANLLNQCPLEKRTNQQWSDSDFQVAQTLEKKLWKIDDFAMDPSTTGSPLSASNEGNLAWVSVGPWGGPASSSRYSEVNEETTVKDSTPSEEGGKSSKDSSPKVSSFSSGPWGTSTNSSRYSEMNEEATMKDSRQPEDHGKSSKDSTCDIIVPLLEPEVFSGTSKQPHYSQRDQQESERSKKENEASGCLVQNKATRGNTQEASSGTVPEKHPDKNKPLANLSMADGLQLMNDVTPPSRGQDHATQLSSGTITIPGISKSINTQTGDFACGSSEGKEEDIRSSAGSLLSSGNLPFLSTLKENKTDEIPRQHLFTPSLHAISDRIKVIQQELNQALPSKQRGELLEVERTFPGSKENIRRAWGGLKSQSTAYESWCSGDSGNSSEAIGNLQAHWETSIQSPWKDASLHAGSGISMAEMAYMTANSTTLWPVFVSQGSFHIRKQPGSYEAEIVEAKEPPYCDSPLEALDIKQAGSFPTHPSHIHSLGEGGEQASHREDMVSRTVGGGITGDALPQCPKLRGLAVSGLSVPYSIGSKGPRPTFLLDQRSASAFVGEMENCPERSLIQSTLLETSESNVIANSSPSQEEPVASPARPPCISQQGPVWVNSPLFTNSLSHGSSDPERRISRSASDTMLPVFLGPSKSSVPSQPNVPNIPLAHNLDFREVPPELKLEAPNTGLFSTEGPKKEDIKAKPEATPSPVSTCPEKLENLQETPKTSQNRQAFPHVDESGNHVAGGRMKAIPVSEGIPKNELTIGSLHLSSGNSDENLAPGPSFSKDPRDPSAPVPHSRTEAGEKFVCSNNLPSSLWKKDENEQPLSNIGNTMWDTNCRRSGASGQASPPKARDIARPEPKSLKVLFKRTSDPFDVPRACPLPGDSQVCHQDSQGASAPSVALTSIPEYPPKNFSILKFSSRTSSRTLQELNMSVEPPSPTEDEESHGIEKPGLSDFSPEESEMMMPVDLGKLPRYVDCNQTAVSNSNSEAPLPQAPEPGPATYPTSLPLLAKPVRESRLSESLVEEQNGHPRNREWLAPETMDALHFISNDITPFLQSWQQEGPARIGWKQYMFGSASDISCSQTSWGLDTQRAIRCSSVDNGLDSQSSPFHSYLSSYANTRGTFSTFSSIEDPQGSEEERKVLTASHIFKNEHRFSYTSTIAPSARTPDNAGEGLPEKGRLPEGENVPAEEGRAPAQAEDNELPYPLGPEAWPKVSKVTCDQGTVTLALPPPQEVHQHLHNCVDIIHPNPEAAIFGAHPCPSTWTNVQSLSMHLSQLLHNTSELLGNLTHQGMAERERAMKAEAPEEVLRVDSSTQTTVDVGIQTVGMDSTSREGSSLLSHREGKLASPQEVTVTAPSQGFKAPDASQEKEDRSLGLQGRGPEDTAKKPISPSPGSQRLCVIPQNALGTSHLSVCFQKLFPGQDLFSLRASRVTSSALSSHVDGSYAAASSPTSGTVSSVSSTPSPQEGGPAGKSGAQKNKKEGFRGALLVDRASSPILTLSASTLCPRSFSSNASHAKSPRSHSLGHHQPPGVSPPVNSSCQTCHEGKAGEVSKDVGNAAGKNPSKGFPAPTPSGAMKQGGWVPGSSTSVSTGPLNHLQQQQQLRTSSESLSWEDHQAGAKKKPFYLSLPPQGPSKEQPEASGPHRFLAEGASEAPKPVSARLGSQEARCPKRVEAGANPPEQPLQSPPAPESLPWGAVLSHFHCPISVSEVSVAPAHSSSLARDTQSEVLLSSCTQKEQTPEPKHYSLRDLPVHNKFSNWRGVQGISSEGSVPPAVANAGSTSSEGVEKPTLLRLSQGPEQLPREQVQVLAGVPLELGPQGPPLSVELAEAKLLYGLGETDALLRVMQTGTGEALVTDASASPHQDGMYFRHLKTVEAVRKERVDRVQSFRRARSLSPMKQFHLLPTQEAFPRDPDLPSRRREYLQQLRKDVVETTRNLESSSDAASHQPSDIEVLLRDYQRAREETKMEIARARDRLRERAEQEKQRIRQQIVTQLQREEAKLQNLVGVNTLCTTSSADSLSSNLTSGYNSSVLTLAGQAVCLSDASVPCFKETSAGDMRGRSMVRNRQLYLKPAGESHHVSLHGSHKSLLSQSNSDSCLPTSPGALYHDLVKHILASTMTEVMAACSDNLQNLFNCQAAAGWKYQGEEKEVLTYYKAFPSATRHGFLGAGVVPQPLPRVWAAVRDPTMWTLYDKSIQTAQLYQRVTSTIKLVYLVSSTSMSCLKQPRDFCCVIAEAKEGQLAIMVAQSVYDKAMPRPSRNVIRGEILPSAWLLQPHTVDGKEVTKVIHMVQVELGAPGLPPGLLTHCAKQQPLVIANLASFLCG
uniref:StAR-related lipid transfer protein 9 n=1 Tax=Monodelphis domestica TaxID=13616 RepID=K7E4J1_MONDO